MIRSLPARAGQLPVSLGVARRTHLDDLATRCGRPAQDHWTISANSGQHTSQYQPVMIAPFLEIDRDSAPKNFADLCPAVDGARKLRNLIQRGNAEFIVGSVPIRRDAGGVAHRFREHWGRDPEHGLIVLPDPSTNSHRKLIVELAARYRVPSIHALRAATADGGLMSYGVDLPDLFRQAAAYGDRILKGAKPADLPVQLPTKFELAINLKTAKALSLEIPPTLLALADEVIE